MLQRRLIVPLLLGTTAVTACGGIDGTEGGAIRENVIEPGITAIDQSRELACSMDARTIQTALDAYATLEGEPAADETTLIDSGFLREKSEAWDVADGVLVAEDASCGPPPFGAPASTVEIVTETETLTVAETFAMFTSDDIESVGGEPCANQLAVVLAGASRYVAETGAEPDTIQEVAAAGYFDEPVTMWQVVDDAIRPVGGSGCLDFVGAPSATSD